MITNTASIAVEERVSYASALLLTKREREILRLIAYEYTTDMIAKKLFLSHHTVFSHRKNMMKKLGVSNVAGLVRKGFEIRVLRI